jgi:nitroreductase
MDLLELIKSRRSIRAFTAAIPSPLFITECLEAATWAPSATNRQPWEFIVLTGAALSEVNRIISDNFALRMSAGDAFGSPPEPLRSRQQDIMETLMRVASEDGIDPGEVFEKSLRFFDAPVAVYFLAYKSDDEQYRLSTAAAIENFLLAAHARGMGTCWLTVTVICQEDIKKHLAIGDDKELLAGVAVGYPRAECRLNTFERNREPVESITRWLGF